MTNTLYGAPLSLFSGKARAYLDWKGVDYQEVLSTPDIYRDVIIPNVGRPVIPVLKTQDGAIVQDTTHIIDHFEASETGPSVYPDTPRQKLAALLLECFGDEWLVIPAMHYRWNYNEEWVYGEFGKLALPDGTPEEQYVAGKERGATFRGFVPMLGITEATIPGIEASYEGLLSELDAHFAIHPFLLGTRPSIGDLGLIGPLYAHLYRDPASRKIMERLAPRVAQWVQRMVDVQTPLSGEFLPDDEIAETLLPILARMMREHVPYLGKVAAMFGEWLAANPETDIPRAVGMTEFTLQDALGSEVSGQRIAVPFSLWMLQRGLDHMDAMQGADRTACEDMLRAAGGEALINFAMPARLNFTDYILTVSS